jgi:hypothetical protein
MCLRSVPSGVITSSLQRATQALLVTRGTMKNVEDNRRIDLLGLFGQPF